MVQPPGRALPPERVFTDLAAKIVVLAQKLARRLKKVYGADRVGFLFTGGDVSHAHAHVIPIVEGTDVTSARYIVTPEGLSWSSSHLRTSMDDLRRVRHELGEMLL